MDGTRAHDARGHDRDGSASMRIDLLPFPVLRLDDAGSVLESNGVLERELGIAPGALVSRSVRELVATESVEEVDRLLEGTDADRVARLAFAAAPGGVHRGFVLVTQPGGRWLVGQPSAFDAQHEADGRTRLEDVGDAKSRFLATMSHELRTPLNAVLGYAGLLRDGVYGKVNDQQDRAINSIVRRAKDLQLQIDDVLDLSRIEAGRMDLRVDEFDPATVLDEVRDEVGALAGAKHLSVVVRYDLRRRVRADRAKYKHVLLNLTSNAVKFTPDRGEVEISVHDGPSDTFITRVRDTGIGIDPRNRAAIFHTFQQVESGNTRRFGGIGLGLSLARRTIEHMGGGIEVESAPGGGTIFSMRLPVRLGAEALPGFVEDVPSEFGAGDPVVLAIDDHPEVIALLRDSLAPAHFRVVGALTGKRGLELARILRPFAITLDIMMPEQDGWQVLREIKSDPAISDIPVIIMSIVSERALGFSLGVTEYLVKPVDRGVLINLLERLRKRQATLGALVVDDDYDARVLMSDLLESLGFHVRASATPAEALRLLDAQVPDVLFVDLTMPADDVGPLLDAVSSERRFESMRVVAVTHSDGASAQSDWLRRVAAQVAFVGRPRPEELLHELRAALSAITADLEPALPRND